MNEYTSNEFRSIVRHQYISVNKALKSNDHLNLQLAKQAISSCEYYDKTHS